MKQAINTATGVASPAVSGQYATSHNLVATPRLIVDWNYNRYTMPVASNILPEDEFGFDVESFPIESITEPLRPGKGVAKAIVGQAVVSDGYLNATDPKFYISSPDDKYKYWVSPNTTNNLGVFPNHTDGITTARPKVEYDRVVMANKIVIRIENTWATPRIHEVRIKTALAGAYAVVGGANPSINQLTGVLTLYYNGTAWVTTKPATLVSTPVAGIEYRVTELASGRKRGGGLMSYRVRGEESSRLTNGSHSNLSIIAIEAHLEADLTDRLIQVSDTFDMADKSQLYPIGTITSNTASLVLSNNDGVFNPENTASPYYRLIDANAEFTMSYVYTIGASTYSVQQFKMYSGEWDTATSEASVELEDYSKYLKETKPNPFMVENKTSTEIVWRVLDSVGFTDYDIQEDDVVKNDTKIPVFWTTGEETVWEVLDELAKATQTAIYFDSFGRLQVRTRYSAFRSAATPDMTLVGEGGSDVLSNIISWTPSGTYEANKISVTYKTTNWKTNSIGLDAMSTVWEPEGESVVVRSAPLTNKIEATTEYISITKSDAKFWPYKSKVQIDGELLEYDGKLFVYYTYTEVEAEGMLPSYTNETKNTVLVHDQEEYDRYNKMTPQHLRTKNYLTGSLKITGRGVWNTEVKDHLVDINGWKTFLELNGKKPSPTKRANPVGLKHNKTLSSVTIKTPPSMKDDGDTFWAIADNTRGPSSGYAMYGTRFRFNKDSAFKTQRAGISYQLSGSREAGYYVEVRPSKSLTAAQRKTRNEVTVYSRKGGKDTVVAKGSATAIGYDIWYELDIYHSKTVGDSQKISVFINGQKVASGTTTAATAQGDSGRFGFFAKGSTCANFEFIYGIARGVMDEPDDGNDFYDLKYGGMRSGMWEREHVWSMGTRKSRLKKRKSKKEQFKKNRFLFDEFGPFVHEVREFDVKFDPAPVRFSSLFNTNQWFSVVPEYYATPFGAKFVVSNVARGNAIIHGEDNLIYAGAGSAVNQVCVVLGQDLEIADDETVEKKNERAIRARGEIEVELSSNWIQSKMAATKLAEWMGGHWSDVVDEVEVTIVGNPLIEIGDIVDIDYEGQHMTPSTHVYYVVGVSNSFLSGIETTLRLRRVRPATVS